MKDIKQIKKFFRALQIYYEDLEENIRHNFEKSKGLIDVPTMEMIKSSTPVYKFYYNALRKSEAARNNEILQKLVEDIFTEENFKDMVDRCSIVFFDSSLISKPNAKLDILFEEPFLILKQGEIIQAMCVNHSREDIVIFFLFYFYF
jgi:hypothetical protein